MKIGYFGEKGAYSNIAAINMVNGDYIPLKSVKSVFESLNNNEIDYGVVPIENSIEGSVNETYDNLYKMNFFIIKEYYLRIKHCLIGIKESDINKIKFVHSHPQALAQCSDFIYKNGYIAINEYDTAGSVIIVRDKNSTEHAAIAGELAAKVYNMKIMARDIENNKNNYTRFFLISKKMVDTDKKSKTSIVFSAENTPGSLNRVLEILNKYNINMTKIESRPVKFSPFNYIFFIDFENNDSSEKAINEIKLITNSLKILGKYEITLL